MLQPKGFMPSDEAWVRLTFFGMPYRLEGHRVHSGMHVLFSRLL